MTNLNEECTEEDLQDFFGDFGDVKNLTMPLNRRTGYVMVRPAPRSTPSCPRPLASLWAEDGSLMTGIRTRGVWTARRGGEGGESDDGDDIPRADNNDVCDSFFFLLPVLVLGDSHERSWTGHC